MAGAIPESFIAALLHKVDIVDVISVRIAVKKSGANNYSARCPFHQEKTPSFSINQLKQFYYCFGCGAKGDAIQFLIEYEGIGFVDAIATLAALAGVAMPAPEPTYHNKHNGGSQSGKFDGNVAAASATTEISPATLHDALLAASTFFAHNLNQKNPVAIDAINYLKNRGIVGATAKKFNLGYALPNWDGLLRHFTGKPQVIGTTGTKQGGGSGTHFSNACLVAAGLAIHKDKEAEKDKEVASREYDRFRDRIMFPIRNRLGKVIGFGGRVVLHGEPKYLNSPETPVFNKSKELYGLYEIQADLKWHSDLLIVEGYLDVISLWQAGIKNAVATLGTAITEQHIQLLFRLKNEVVFCFDGDTAGQKACWRALE
jgi:DNA primase